MTKRQDTIERVLAMRERHPFARHGELAAMCGVSRATVSLVLSGRYERHGNQAREHAPAVASVPYHRSTDSQVPSSECTRSRAVLPAVVPGSSIAPPTRERLMAGR